MIVIYLVLRYKFNFIKEQENVKKKKNCVVNGPLMVNEEKPGVTL